jgi:hypothetical protein
MAKKVSLYYSHLSKRILYQISDVAYRTDCNQHICKSLNSLLQIIKCYARIIAYTKWFFL